MTVGRLRRKVRWPRTVDCGHYVLRGETIIGRDGLWICRPCAIAAIKTTAASPAAAAPKEGRS